MPNTPAALQRLYLFWLFGMLLILLLFVAMAAITRGTLRRHSTELEGLRQRIQQLEKQPSIEPTAAGEG